jgi:NodT family efflux transporter outer membrane factor (OMF) lipoprotein
MPSSSTPDTMPAPKPRPSLFRAALLALTLATSCVPALHDAAARDADLSLPKSFPQTVEPDTSTALGVEGFFEDPELVALVDEALAHNQELNIVRQEFVIAQAEILARRGEYLPFVSFMAGAGIEKVGEFTSQGASDAADPIRPGHRVPENLQDYSLGFNASWEIDVWKKLRNATKAAVYRYLSTVEGRNFLVTQLVAEIAHTYYELLALDGQLEVLNRNIQIQGDALRIVRIEKEAGRVTELAVQRFEAEVLDTRSRVFEIRQRIVQAENRLNFLVGRYPQPIEREGMKFLDLRPSPVRSGLPAQLLENRPDVRRAELELRAAKLDVQVARASFYPSLSLDAAVGLEAYRAESLPELPESILYRAASNVTAPLLNRRALVAGYWASNSRQMQAVLTFERTLREAFMESANQLSLITNLASKYELKSRQVELLEAAIEVSSRLFASARADYMEVLLTRRDALDAEMELIETRQQQFSAVVDLYRALGGGWRHGLQAETTGNPNLPTE